MDKKGLTNEQWNKIGEQILKFKNERISESIDENKSVLPKLRTKAKELGFEFNNDSELNGICFNNPNLFKETLLNLYKESQYIVEKEYLLQCLGSHQNGDLMEFYLEELYKHNSPLIRYALGNCIMRIPDKIHIDKYIDLLYNNNYPEIAFYVGGCLAKTTDIKYKDTYLKMLCDNKLGRNRLYVIQAIGKLKLKEAIPKLIELLDDEYLCESALDALNKFKDPALIKYFEKYKNHNDSFIRNSAKKGIQNIEKLLNKSNNYS